MFEYLMPLLVMPTYEATLLDQTCRAAVQRQVAYGRQRDVPWGISESAFAQRDQAGNYQYRAFGLPLLALNHDEGNALVISPYSTFLALHVDPTGALRNLRRMASDGWLSAYGFYDAADYTTSSGRRSWRLIC